MLADYKGSKSGFPTWLPESKEQGCVKHLCEEEKKTPFRQIKCRKAPKSVEINCSIIVFSYSWCSIMPGYTTWNVEHSWYLSFPPFRDAFEQGTIWAAIRSIPGHGEPHLILTCEPDTLAIGKPVSTIYLFLPLFHIIQLALHSLQMLFTAPTAFSYMAYFKVESNHRKIKADLILENLLCNGKMTSSALSKSYIKS